MAIMEPLPENPTNGDLAKGILQLHNCLEEHRSKSKSQLNDISKQFKALKSNQTKMQQNIKNLDDGQLNVIRSLELVKDAFKLNNDSIKPTNKPIALMGQMELLMKFGGMITGSLVIWKTAWTIGPYLWQAAQALIK